MLDSLATEMIERKVLDLILDTAEYEDVPLTPRPRSRPSVATVEEQAVPGEMNDHDGGSGRGEARRRRARPCSRIAPAERDGDEPAASRRG